MHDGEKRELAQLVSLVSREKKRRKKNKFGVLIVSVSDYIPSSKHNNIITKSIKIYKIITRMSRYFHGKCASYRFWI